MADKAIKLANLALTAAKPRVSNFLYYARYELTPPTPGQIPEVIKGYGRLLAGWKNGAWKKLTVKEAMVNAAVSFEVLCWFYVGECIGKRHLIGYKLG